MTLQDRLREAYLSHGINYVQEAADRIDAQEKRIRELEGALRELEIELPVLRDENANMRECLRSFVAAWNERDDLEHELQLMNVLDRAREALK